MRKRGWILLKEGGQQAVLGHREEDARLAEQRDEADRGEARDRGDLDAEAEPGGSVDLLQGEDEGGVDVEAGVFDHAGEHQRHADEQERADREAAEQADGHVALRVFRLLRGGGDVVEADVGEEDHGRSP